MKHFGQRLELRCWKTQSESNQTWAKVHLKIYSAVVAAGKKQFFSASIASVQIRPEDLFQEVRRRLPVWPQAQDSDHSAAHSLKINLLWICSDFNTVVYTGHVNVTLAPACPVIMDAFRLVHLEDVGRILGKVKATTCARSLFFLTYKSGQRGNGRVDKGNGECFLAVR